MKEIINKMCYTLKMPVTEIAKALDISVETVVENIETPKWTL